MNPYETLGVERDATVEQVKAAFRALAKRHHPDMSGGENEAFNAIRRACDVLCDPAARKFYDECGILPDDPDSVVVLRARQEVSAMYAALLGRLTPAEMERTDVIGTLRRAVENDIASFDNVLTRLEAEEREVMTHRAVLDRRLRRKAAAGGDVFGQVLTGMTAQIASQRLAVTDQRAVKRAVLAILDDYAFDFERETSWMASATSTGWANVTAWPPAHSY